MSLQVVEVSRTFRVEGHDVSPGAKVLAWSNRDGAWMVCFNGTEVRVPPGTVYPLGTAPEKKDSGPAYSSARLEQYQLAPAESKKPS